MYKRQSYQKHFRLQICWSNSRRERALWRLCCTMSKNVGVVYKVKHFIKKLVLLSLYRSLLISRVQYGIIAQGIATEF